MPESLNNLTQLLVNWGNGDQNALDQLTPAVYLELQRLARGYLRRERPGQSQSSPPRFLRVPRPRVINQNPAHQLGRDPKEMRPILPPHAVLVD